MSWNYKMVNSITGSVIGDLHASDASWSMRMGSQVGRGRLTVPTKHKFYKGKNPADWLDTRRSWARTIVGCYDDVPVWGKIVSGSPSLNSSGLLTLPTAEVGELLRRRLYFGAGLYSPYRTESFSNYSRVGMFNAVARLVCGGGAGAPVSGSMSPWQLPVWIDTPQSGNWSRSSRQHEFESPWQDMVDIASGGAGLDFVFAPGFWSGGAEGETERAFQWVLHAGASLERSRHEYHLGAEKSPVQSWDVTWDATNQQTGVFMLGEGYGAKRPVGMATPEDSMVMPAMDIAVSRSRESSVSTLNDMAENELRALRHPTEVWRLKFAAPDVLKAMHGGINDGLRPGSRVVLHPDDPVVGHARRELMVTGMSGTDGLEVTVEAEPV